MASALQQQITAQRQQLTQAKAQIVAPRATQRELLSRGLQQRLKAKSRVQAVKQAKGRITSAEQSFEKEVAEKAPQFAKEGALGKAFQEATKLIQSKISSLDVARKAYQEKLNKELAKGSERSEKREDSLRESLRSIKAELGGYTKGLVGSKVDVVKKHFSGYTQQMASYAKRKVEASISRSKARRSQKAKQGALPLEHIKEIRKFELAHPGERLIIDSKTYEVKGVSSGALQGTFSVEAYNKRIAGGILPALDLIKTIPVSTISEVSKAEGFLPRIQEKISRQRAELTTRALRKEQTIKDIPVSLALGGFQFLTSATQFGAQALTQPVETTKDIASGSVELIKKTASGEGIPEIGQMLREEPGFSVGLIAGEFVGAKGLGRVGKVLIGEEKALTQLSKVKPDVSLGFVKKNGDISKILIKTIRKGNGAKSETLSTFNVRKTGDKTFQIEAGTGMQKITLDRPIMPKQIDEGFTFAGKGQETTARQVIQKRVPQGDILKLKKELKNLDVSTGDLRIIFGKDDLTIVKPKVFGIAEKPKGKFTRFVGGEIERAVRPKIKTEKLIDLSNGKIKEKPVYGDPFGFGKPTEIGLIREISPKRAIKEIGIIKLSTKATRGVDMIRPSTKSLKKITKEKSILSKGFIVTKVEKEALRFAKTKVKAKSKIKSPFFVSATKIISKKKPKSILSGTTSTLSREQTKKAMAISNAKAKIINDLIKTGRFTYLQLMGLTFVSLQRLAQKVKAISKPLGAVISTTSKPTKPKKLIKPIKDLEKKKIKKKVFVLKKRAKAVIPEMKRFGKWKPISKATSQAKARKKAVQKVKDTLGASLRLREKGTTNLIKIKKVPKDFRRSKKLPGVLIEKRNKRLSGSLEVKEIKTFRKRKVKSKKKRNFKRK